MKSYVNFIKESTYEDRILFDNQKVSQDIKDKLKYKEGDVVEINETEGNTIEIVEIIFVRKPFVDELRVNKNKMIYGVVKLGYDPDNYYFEIPESKIIRKLEPHEISALKYNI